MVKPDFDTLVTVPEDPPAAGPDRALDPPPADPGGSAAWTPEVGCAADADGDVGRPTESPIMGAEKAAATMLRIFFFVSTRRAFGVRSCLGEVTEVDQSGEDV